MRATVRSSAVTQHVTAREAERGPVGSPASIRPGVALSVLGDAVLGPGGFAPAILAVSVLAATTSRRRLLRPVRVIGSMPLTAYTAHLLVWGFWSGRTRRAG